MYVMCNIVCSMLKLCAFQNHHHSIVFHGIIASCANLVLQSFVNYIT